MTRVSIVTPFLDAALHLGAAIDSVRAQTVPDWELLLVDDGSTDGGSSLAACAAARDRRIRYIPSPPSRPGGAAAARNRGIALAHGDFVAFLDADDLLEPYMLATTLDAFDRHPSAAMVFGPTLWWHPDDSRPPWLEPTDGRAGRLHRPPSLLASLILLLEGQVPCTCSVLVRRSVLDAVGGFEERFHLYEDQTLWVKIFRHYDVFVTPVCLSRYRQHAASASARATSEGEYHRMGAHPARAHFLKWVETYLNAGPPPSLGLALALRLAMAPYRTDPNLSYRLDRLAHAAHARQWRMRQKLRRNCFRPAGNAGAVLGRPPSP
jgi:glycosyltransferase involved in cell wall biosynthesis